MKIIHLFWIYYFYVRKWGNPAWMLAQQIQVIVIVYLSNTTDDSSTKQKDDKNWTMKERSVYLNKKEINILFTFMISFSNSF